MRLLISSSSWPWSWEGVLQALLEKDYFVDIFFEGKTATYNGRTREREADIDYRSG